MDQEVDRVERWWLDSAEAVNAEAPGSFFIPPVERRRNLQPGDQVKLLFRFDPPVEGYNVERMWVEVESVAAGEYRGRLRSDPSYMSALSYGDPVDFGPEHVAAYAWDPDELGYLATEQAWVPNTVVPGSEHPRRVTMRPPELRAGEKDSGWLLWSGDESQDEVTNVELFRWSELGWLTDLFPELEGVFRSDGREWEWNPGTGVYDLIA
jgi:hypothetical protein